MTPSAFLNELLLALLSRPPGGGYGPFGRALARAVPFDRLTLCVVEEDGLRVLQALCADNESSEAVGRLLPLGGSLAGRVYRSGRSQRFDDVSLALGSGAPEEDVLRALRAGMTSALLTPLRHDGQLMGLCQLWARRAQHFDAAHEELLEWLGPALGAALRSDVLFAQAERRSLELGALERLAHQTRESLALDQVVRACLDTALSLLGLPAGGLLLRRGAHLELCGERNLSLGRPAPLRGEPPPGEPPSPLQEAVLSRQPVLCEDLSREPLLGERLRQQGKSWLLALPLVSGEERCGVVFACGHGSYPHSTGDLGRLRAVGAWLGAAIAEAERHAQARQEAERRRREQQLEGLSSLAGGLAHDLNNTLGTVLCTALLVREDATRGAGVHLRPEQLREDMDTVIQAAQRGAQLADQLLAFSRGAPLSLELLDVNALVQEALAPVRDRGALSVDTQLDPALPRVRGDRAQLLRALQNLLRNAEEAMPKGGRLRVETRMAERAAAAPGGPPGEGPSGRFVRVAIHDEGPGVDPAVRGRLFEPFVTTKKSAAGLGLAVVFGVLRAHGGHAAADLDSARGATFYVDLPPAEAPRPPALSQAPVAAGARVLVVDDEPALGRVAARVLVRGGHAVDLVSSGAEALARYDRSGAYDLVILDSTMPGMSGREVLDALLRRDPAARVLVMSGYSIDGGPAQLLEEGARGFLPKPFTPSELLAAARAALSGP